MISISLFDRCEILMNEEICKCFEQEQLSCIFICNFFKTWLCLVKSFQIFDWFFSCFVSYVALRHRYFTCLSDCVDKWETNSFDLSLLMSNITSSGIHTFKLNGNLEWMGAGGKNMYFSSFVERSIAVLCTICVRTSMWIVFLSTGVSEWQHAESLWVSPPAVHRVAQVRGQEGPQAAEVQLQGDPASRSGRWAQRSSFREILRAVQVGGLTVGPASGRSCEPCR